MKMRPIRRFCLRFGQNLGAIELAMLRLIALLLLVIVLADIVRRTLCAHFGIACHWAP